MARKNKKYEKKIEKLLEALQVKKASQIPVPLKEQKKKHDSSKDACWPS